MMIRPMTLFLSLAVPAVAAADSGGVLNPEEMTAGRMLDNVHNGQTDMMTCASGYFMTKKGDHGDARKVFTACADDGYSAAMTWMSQLEDNGLGAPEDAEAATEWSRRAAESGDPVGKFNYGLSLLRGRGTPMDATRGRALVDEAARDGLEIARRLRGADYDPAEVTPDADNLKFAPMF